MRQNLELWNHRSLFFCEVHCFKIFCSDEQSPCKVWCHMKTSGFIRTVGNFPDGTPCGTSSYCVKGECLVSKLKIFAIFLLHHFMLWNYYEDKIKIKISIIYFILAESL